MKIKKVVANNRKKAFEVSTRSKTYIYPYVEAKPSPSSKDKVSETFVDMELGKEGFSYVLESGEEGTIHIDDVLDYNKDPDYMTDVLLYKLTVEAQKGVEESPLSVRELIRRLGTSPTQFYRLLDQTNYRKSVRQMLSLLSLLGCEVDIVIRKKAG